jgi:hypothetical protein
MKKEARGVIMNLTFKAVKCLRQLAWLPIIQVAACSTSCQAAGGPATAIPGPNIPTPVASAARNVEQALKAQALSEQMTDFVQGRKVPQGFTSIERDPGLLLGSVYVLRVKPGKTCASVVADDYQQDRLQDFRRTDEACKVIPFPNQVNYDELVSGSASIELEVVVGKGKVDVEATYELKVENAQTAAFESSRKCIDKEALLERELPDRTCLAYYITGAVLTHITWRAYRKVDAQLSGSYLSMIKVGANLMGSTSSMKVTPVISVDTVDPGIWRTGEDGFLHVARAKADKKDAVEQVDQVIKNLDSGKKPRPTERDEKWRSIFKEERTSP